MRLLSQIKKDMEFNLNLYNLVEVLKEIAIAQYKILEKKIKTFDDVFSALNEIFGLMSVSNLVHPLLVTEGRQTGVIALTSDAGLLGGLNMGVMSQAIKEAEKTRAKLIIIGERGQLYARESDLSFVVFKGVKDETRFAQAQELRNFILQEELAGKLGDLKIVYPFSTSIVSQHVKTLQLFPFSTPEQFRQQTAVAGKLDIIAESDLGDILEYWMYLYLGQKFYQIFGLSRLAELSARFTHLESSKTKVEQLNKELRLQYFRQRHELIDKNMRELFAARLAFK
ncbi:MAG: F0F1 ATP synthase subunit gamma [Candidatus Omnitrophica bacterium]|nr:F0F1 ATP synthase subunit gamma [Candidatus Omnitrophota bacterium]